MPVDEATDKQKAGMTPIDPQLLEALEYTARTNREKHENRIGREFQVLVASLTLFVASVAVTFTEHFPENKEPFKWCTGFGFLAVAIGAFFYFKRSSEANDRDQAEAEAAEEEILAQLKSRTSRTFQDYLEKRPKSIHPNRWRWAWSAATVIAGAVLSLIVIWYT
jgi:hypothetical protein